jgi:hypothetical protein
MRRQGETGEVAGSPPVTKTLQLQRYGLPDIHLCPIGPISVPRAYVRMSGNAAHLRDVDIGARDVQVDCGPSHGSHPPLGGVAGWADERWVAVGLDEVGEGADVREEAGRLDKGGWGGGGRVVESMRMDGM